MTKIGIIGSCITRDVFNSKHVKNWKEFFDVTAYQSQITIPSLMSVPVVYNQSNAVYKNMDDFSINQINTELSKSILSNLIKSQPDYLIIDFYGDLFFGVVQAKNGGYITNKNWMFSRTNIFNENIESGITLNVEKNLKAYYDLWCESIKKLYSFLETYLPNTEVVIHHSKFIGVYEDEKIIKSVGEAMGVFKDTHYLNSVWNKLTNYLKNNYHVKIIDQTEKDYKINHKHIWGVHYVHYENEYYIDFKNKLLDLVIDDTINSKTQNNNLNLIRGDKEFSWNSTNKNVCICDGSIIQISQNNLNKNLYSQCYSRAFEFYCQEPITVKFQIYIDDKINLDDNRIFTIRTFNDNEVFTQSEANQYYYYKIEDFKVNQWIDIQIDLKLLDGKYFRVIPILFKNGMIKYKNISVKYYKNQ
ncbi:DUF6270 domain-containing protein [Mammaliicoccus sciuri]|uniref:DUF6270 domain-containing protein n=1 Tax=Mammaliicoccus sciuri TaxID=1296 RepID=UPI002DB89480|nr:DUF6270 domain-containing protein [Mammaliicoccus sciuri]MEB7466191.1 DUF6270 domain-containing protein [Mammaliicoccus sciuri]